MKQRGKKKNEFKKMRTISETSRTILNCLKTRIIGVPEEEDKKKDHEKIPEEIIVENSHKWGSK